MTEQEQTPEASDDVLCYLPKLSELPIPPEENKAKKDIPSEPM